VERSRGQLHGLLLCHSMSAPPIHPHAWITCPCGEDPDFDAESAQFSLTLLAELSTAGFEVCLPRKPRIGALLSAELLLSPRAYSAPIVAHVIAVQKQSDGWLAHCGWVAPMTEGELQALLDAPPE
jgi:hypothetical protein